MSDQTQGSLRLRKGWRPANFMLKGLAVVSVLLLCGYGSTYVDRHPAASMARKLGLPEQLLLGLGNTDVADIKAQKIKVDILDHYLVGVGESSWASWNTPRGDYIRVVTEQADSLGAVPMFTLAQMTDGEDGNLSALDNRVFMTAYWDNVRLLFIKLGQYDGQALVNLEPDFWGHVQKRAPDGDPAMLGAMVSINRDCADLPDDVSGMAACLLRSAGKYAPKVQLGFPVADWGGRSDQDVALFMKRLGAGQADFVVFPSEMLGHAGSGLQDYLGKVRFYHEAIGDLPVLLWRASLAVSSGNSREEAGQDGRSHVQDLLKSPGKLVGAGAVAVVFSAGETDQVDITTDGGQFRIMSFQYSANPAPLS